MCISTRGGTGDGNVLINYFLSEGCRWREPFLKGMKSTLSLIGNLDLTGYVNGQQDQILDTAFEMISATEVLKVFRDYRIRLKPFVCWETTLLVTMPGD